MKRVIAIDFGTTHTYISTCTTESLNPTCVQLHGDANGIDTTILYSNKREPVIGKRATNEFGDAFDEERKRYEYRFESHFKPDILASEKARRCTVEFLSAILRDAKNEGIQLAPETAKVIISVPSEAAKEYRLIMQQLAQEAGFGTVELIDEPIGALFDEVGRGYLPLEAIRAGLLVIDFGGGTCDFAFMQQGKVVHSWGEMGLGGRLFDDMFYQWFLDLRPGKKEEIEKDGSDFYARTCLCRELKEKFSDAMRHDRTTSFKAKVGEYGRVEGLTWDEFIRRSKSYTPSESFIRFQKKAGLTISPTLQSGSIDLIYWFKKSLVEGLRSAGITRKGIHAISLAGGSSKWSFVKDSCLENLKVDESIISQNPNPYAAISEGVAVYPALKKKIDAQREDLKANRESFFKEKIASSIHSDLRACGKNIVEDINRNLFLEKIKPRLVAFRDNGGKISELKSNIAADVSVYEPALSSKIEEIYQLRIANVYQTAFEKIRTWFKEKGLKLGESESMSMGEQGGVEICESNFDTGVAESIGEIVAGIAVIIGGFIAGYLGAGLLATGPIGWLIGIIALGVGGALAFAYGADMASKMAEDLHIPGTALYFVLTDAKIEECRKRMAQEITAQLNEKNDSIVENIWDHLDDVILREIDKLSELNV